MTSNDEWVRERAIELCPFTYALPDWKLQHLRETVAGGLREAIERGKAEQDKAVAAERERTLDAIINAFENGRRDVIARLENPDEAMVEAVRIYAMEYEEHPQDVCRAIARTLTEGQENSDG